jgi:hypothetical protein
LTLSLASSLRLLRSDWVESALKNNDFKFKSSQVGLS